MSAKFDDGASHRGEGNRHGTTRDTTAYERATSNRDGTPGSRDAAGGARSDSVRWPARRPQSPNRHGQGRLPQRRRQGHILRQDRQERWRHPHHPHHPHHRRHRRRVGEPSPLRQVCGGVNDVRSQGRQLRLSHKSNPSGLRVRGVAAVANSERPGRGGPTRCTNCTDCQTLRTAVPRRGGQEWILVRPLRTWRCTTALDPAHRFLVPCFALTGPWARNFRAVEGRWCRTIICMSIVQAFVAVRGERGT
jgi:hypothetical protein